MEHYQPDPLRRGAIRLVPPGWSLAVKPTKLSANDSDVSIIHKTVRSITKKIIVVTTAVADRYSVIVMINGKQHSAHSPMPIDEAYVLADKIANGDR